MSDPVPVARPELRKGRAESPLDWLAARGLVSPGQHRAGERLRRDYTRAGLSPRITMDWRRLAEGAGPGGKAGGQGGHGQATLAAIDAHRAFHRAIDALGPGLGDVAWRVLCALEPLPEAERALGWPGRSGRVVLTLALDRLRAHYDAGAALRDP